MVHDSTHGIDWVPVDDEPMHRELFQNPLVRVYEATIPPGHSTQDHRHDHDTVYVIVRGGVFRSDNSWPQTSATKLGRSTGLLRTIEMLVRRLTVGWLQMPDGTLLWQPHGNHPLVHRVAASPENTHPIRMLGVELRSNRPPRRMPGQAGARLEHSSPHTTSYRITATTPVDIPGQAVLTVVHGTATTPSGTPAASGETHWIPAPGTLHPGTQTLAVLTLV